MTKSNVIQDSLLKNNAISLYQLNKNLRIFINFVSLLSYLFLLNIFAGCSSNYAVSVVQIKPNEDSCTNLYQQAKKSQQSKDYDKALKLYQYILTNECQNHLEFVASILSELGSIYKVQQRFDEAEKTYQQSLTIFEKIYGKEHIYVANVLSQLAWIYHDLGNYDKAKLVHQRSLAIREKVFGKDHVDIFDSLDSLADIYCHLGDYRSAVLPFQRAIAIKEKTYGKEHPRVAASLNSLAVLYYYMGDYDKALPLYQKALDIWEKTLKTEHPDIATSLNNLAWIYQTMGDYDKALPLFQKSLDILEKTLGKEHSDVATGLNNIAGLYKKIGDYKKALPLFQKSLGIRKKVLGKEHPDVAQSFNNLAGLYRMMGDYDKALLLLEKSLDIRKKVLGKEHSSVATNFNNLAALYQTMGDYNKALPLFQKSLEIFKKALGEEHLSVATSSNNLAALYYKMGNYDEALSLFQKSLEIKKRILGKEHPAIAGSLNNVALLYLDLKNYEKAEPLLQQALPIAANSDQPEILWKIQSGLHSLFAKQNNPDAAIFFGKQAVNTIQGLRANVSTMDKALQKSFLGNKNHVYQSLAELLIEQGRIPEAQQILDLLKEEEYFDFIYHRVKDNNRIVLADFSSFERLWAERYQKIIQRLGSLGNEHRQLKQKAERRLTDEEKVHFAQIKETIQIESQKFITFVEELKMAFKQATVVDAKEVINNLKSLQNTLKDLGDGVVLIHYFITEEKLRLILTTPDSQVVRDAAVTKKDLNRKIFQFKQNLQITSSWNYIKDAKELYQWIIKPIESDLKQVQAKMLMLSLDGILRYIPIAALIDENNEYVVQRYATAIYTSAGHTKLTNKPQEKWTIAGFGLSDAVSGFHSLPFVIDELNNIIKQDDNDEIGVIEGVVYLNKKFNAQAMLKVLDEKYPVLHIASHFVFQPGTLQNSYLLLGTGEPLTLQKIKEDYDFNHLDLLTLSACNTATGANANGQEIEGFGALAQNQGAKSVLATLWSVNDSSTGEFMRRFYKLQDSQSNLSKAEAIQQVQQSFLKEPPLNKAYYWAPFILMGNWL